MRLPSRIKAMARRLDELEKRKPRRKRTTSENREELRKAILALVRRNPSTVGEIMELFCERRAGVDEAEARVFLTQLFRGQPGEVDVLAAVEKWFADGGREASGG